MIYFKLADNASGNVEYFELFRKIFSIPEGKLRYGINHSCPILTEDGEWDFPFTGSLEELKDTFKRFLNALTHYNAENYFFALYGYVEGSKKKFIMRSTPEKDVEVREV